MRKIFFIFLIFFAGFWGWAGFCSAQTAALAITPPLIKNNVTPGQIWKSSIKLVNNSAREITAYVQVLDFKGGAKSGTVEFVEPGEIGESAALSSWIVLLKNSVPIGPYKSAEIPFVIDVPQDAEPGGHYAAILSGTRPPDNGSEGASIRISSMLASLILLNVKGDVREEGRIREFVTPRKIYTEPEVEFSLRFENMGNVHLQPQGEIKVFNLFDKERGTIDINHKTDYGNVLPGEIRDWNFVWKGEDSFLEMGRYRAELALSFGNEAKSTDTRTYYFWVLYPRPLAISIGSLLLFFSILVLSIRFYIKRAILRSRQLYGALPAAGARPVVDLKYPPLSRPAPALPASGRGGRLLTISLFLIALTLIGSGIYYYSWQSRNNVNFVITEEESGDLLSLVESGLSEEDVFAGFEELEGQSEAFRAEGRPGDFYISILNGSGAGGRAGELSNRLLEKGYNILEVGNASGFGQEESLVRYKGVENFLVQDLEGLLNSYSPEFSQEIEEDAIIIIGTK